MQYYIGIVTGAILLIGALVILGFGKRVYVNASTGEVIEFSVPVLGRVKTSSPFVVFAFIGFALIVTCSKMIPKEELISVDGQISSSRPVEIYFVAIPSYEYHQDVSGPFHTTLPKIANARYRAKLVVDGSVLDDKPLTVIRDRANLSLFTVNLPTLKESVNVTPEIKVSDEQAKAFLK